LVAASSEVLRSEKRLPSFQPIRQSEWLVSLDGVPQAESSVRPFA